MAEGAGGRSFQRPSIESGFDLFGSKEGQEPIQRGKEQAIIYQDEVAVLAAEKQMNYIPSFARKSWNQGHANLLSRQLEKRFGALPAAVTELLQNADADTIEQWGLRFVDAGTLDEIFAAPVRKRRRRAAVYA